MGYDWNILGLSESMQSLPSIFGIHGKSLFYTGYVIFLLGQIGMSIQVQNVCQKNLGEHTTDLLLT